MKLSVYLYFQFDNEKKTRGSQQPVIVHLVFNLPSKVYRKWGHHTKFWQNSLAICIISINQLKEKNSQKTPVEMLIYLLSCCFSLNLSPFLVTAAILNDTILKRNHLNTIPAKFGLLWVSGFRGEDLNMKVYNVPWMPSDGKSSHCLWPGELKTITFKKYLQ